MYDELALTASVIGLLFSIKQVVDVPVIPVSGWLADFSDKTRLLTISYVILLASVLLLYFAPFSPFFFSLLALTLNEIGGTVGSTASFTFIRNLIGGEKYGEFYGIYNFFTRLSLFTTGFIVGSLIEISSFQTAFILTGLILIICILTAFLLSSVNLKKTAETGIKRRNPRNIIRDYIDTFRTIRSMRLVLYYLLLSSGIVFFLSVYFLYTELYIKEVLRFRIFDIGVLTLAWGAGNILSSYVSGKACDKMGKGYAIFLFGFPYTILLIFFGLKLLTTFDLLILFYLSFGVWQGSMFTISGALISKICPMEHLGRVSSLDSAATSLAGLFAVSLGGLLWHHISPSTPFLVGGIGLMVMYLAAAVLYKDV